MVKNNGVKLLHSYSEKLAPNVSVSGIEKIVWIKTIYTTEFHKSKIKLF